MRQISNCHYTFSLQTQYCQYQSMDLFDIAQVKMPKLENPHKVLQTLKKIQFIMEFFVLSKYSSNPDVISEFLMTIEAFKFYYKMAHFSHQESIYLENHQQKPHSKKEVSLKPLEKMSQLLEQIKTKTYECKDYQPEQFQELACGKKMQLVTSVEVPKELRRPKLNFWALLGEVIFLLRPLLSIIAIRLFGMENFKSYFISLGIDLFTLIILQRNMIVSRKGEITELENRKKEILMRYLFRRPFFMVLKQFLIEPCLQKLMSKERIIYKLILSLLEMQSSITLTL